MISSTSRFVRRAASGLFFLSALVVLLAGCGGGGGGGGSSASSLTYSGKTTAATLDSSSAESVSREGYQTGGTGTAVGGRALSGGGGSTDARRPGTLVVAEALGSAITGYDPATDAGSASAVFTTGLTPDNTCSGTQGSGTATVDYNPLTGKLTGTFSFSGFCSDGVKLTGTASLTGFLNTSTLQYTRLDLTFGSLTAVTSVSSTTVSGEISYDYTASPTTILMNILLRDDAASKTYRVENLNATLDEQTTYTDLAISSGRIYVPDYGYVDVATTTPLRYYGDAEWPTEGVMVFTGASSAKARLTVYASESYRVEADTDSDGNYDWDSGAQTWPGTDDQALAPTADPGSDRSVYAGDLVALDGTSSASPYGDTLTYSWSLDSKPSGSTATLSSTTASGPTFTADKTGEYVASLTVSDDNDTSSAATVTITAVKAIDTLSFDVVDAEYSDALDKIVMISASPDLLHVYDPVTETDTTVALPLTPACVSVSPDGLYAAVGHDANITYVNLSTAAVEKNLTVTTDVFDIVLDGNGYVHAFPRAYQWVRIHTVNISTGTETESTGNFVSERTSARLHPNGNAIYGADKGLYPADIEKYDIQGGTAAYLYDSPYHGDYSMCGDLWISEDGTRVITKCGTVFQSTDTQATDMLYAGSLNQVSWIESLDDSSATGNVLVVPMERWDIITPNDTQLQTYGFDFLTYGGTVTLPKFIVSGTGYDSHGRFVFYNSDGSRYFVIVQADSSAGVANDYGIVTY